MEGQHNAVMAVLGWSATTMLEKFLTLCSGEEKFPSVEEL